MHTLGYSFSIIYLLVLSYSSNTHTHTHTAGIEISLLYHNHLFCMHSHLGSDVIMSLPFRNQRMKHPSHTNIFSLRGSPLLVPSDLTTLSDIYKVQPSKHAGSNLHPIQIGLKGSARSGHNGSFTLACFQTESIWPKLDTVSQNQTGSVLLKPDTDISWGKNTMRRERFSVWL